MDLGVVLDQARTDAMTAAGHWPDRLILDYLDDVVAKAPDKVAITDHNSMTGRSTTLSYRQLDRLGRRIAVGLAARGIEKGDVVAYQLPNWWQFTALHLACLRIGAITNPLMPIFRERELEFMLSFAESKLFIVPREFRGFDHAAMARGLRDRCPDLEHVFVIGGDGEQSFERTFVERRWEDEPGTDAEALFAERRPGANDVVELMYTSGTTGQPKGVMHTPNTLIACLSSSPQLGLGADDVFLMASPMAHQTGFLYGMLMPIMLGGRAVLQDVWDPEAATRIIHDERVSFTMASTPFLADLAGTAALERYNLDSLNIFIAAGAPIPRVLVQTAHQRLGAHIVAGWGMTENGLATATRTDDPNDKVFETDGTATKGMEVRVVDEDGKPLPPGTEGDLQARGAATFVGYLKRPDLYAADAEGWFETGDIARIDEQGYIRITSRAKDIIIRGGENVPVIEVEELLYRHPAVEACAIVAMPDERLGERGCAFITPKAGQSLTFEQMIAYLTEQKMAKNYLPERLELVDEMPRTPSGKIQKFKLRQQVEEKVADESDS